MKKLAAVAVIAILFNCTLFASDQQTEESFGVIVLKSGKHLNGGLTYHFKQDLIILSNNSFGKKAFSPDKVSYFRFYDDNLERERLFTTLSIPNKYGYKSEGFYEVLEEGEMTIIGKLKNQDFAQNDEQQYGYAKTQIERVERTNSSYDFKIINGEELHLFADFKRNLLPKMAKRFPQIQDFINSNRLYLRSDDEKIKVIAFYNRLINDEANHGFASSKK